MNREELTAFIIESLRKEMIEAKRLETCEHEQDFIGVAESIIKDMAVLADRYDTMLLQYRMGRAE